MDPKLQHRRTLGLIVRARRNRLGMSIEKLASLSGLSEHTIAKIEKTCEPVRNIGRINAPLGWPPGHAERILAAEIHVRVPPPTVRQGAAELIVTFSTRRWGPKGAKHPSVGEPCSACGNDFKQGDYTALIQLGPGDDPVKQDAARAGEEYDAETTEVHYACATGIRDGEE